MTTIKDPVCGMMVPVGEELSVIYQGQEFRFCSDLCRRAFLGTPKKYATGAAGLPPGAPHVTRRIAYFSMEVAVESGMPTYSGGLGVLAGDTLRSCADLKIPLVAVSLLYTKGYFEQKLDEWGNQHERPVRWDPTGFVRLLPITVQVSFKGRSVVVRVWQYDVIGSSGYLVPLLFLDTNVEANAPNDRDITAYLYGGDEAYRLAQETVLGFGGVRVLRALGYTELDRFHMNEGHAAFLTLELLRERQQQEPGEWDFNGVRRHCIFTTLAKRHGEVSQEMFPGYPIDSITNGIHSPSWTAPSFQNLYDRYIPGWRTDPFSLRYAVNIPTHDISAAHEGAKARLLAEVKRRTNISLNQQSLTLGFARRATLYKRADLVFSEPGRLLEIAQKVGLLQFIFAGKAHPRDEPGKEMIRRVVQAAKELQPQVRIVYLENYDVALAQLLTAGADLWLNMPERPLEASGTSGMKAAHNGVPSLSVLDGWWIEGHIEGTTGWCIGPPPGEPTVAAAEEAREFYEKLEGTIVPMYYRVRDQWIDVMRHTIAFNASFFNTHRMVQQYAVSAYV